MNRTAVATRYTYQFVRRSLPAGARQVLEIGCGAGELAVRLQQDGIAVRAIDRDADCVAAAQAVGVDARQVSWPAALDERFDAILFTRSLHHIDELEEAIAAARKALRPGGRIIVEDFCAEGGTQRSAAWFSSLVRVFEASGAFRSAFDAVAMLAKLDVAEEHELHGSAILRSALGGFATIEEEDAAYYFRYFEPELRQPLIAEALLDHELELIRVSAIDPLGKRFVAYE